MYHRDYDNIQMIEQLRQLMTLDANMNTSDIEERFEQIVGFPVKLESPYKICDYRPLFLSRGLFRGV